ncbi:MAG: hypothetical protein HZB63_04955 [Deltaproteobacteria bacterium]|nr:hypothetical protein [Deltaproteobacteria bacterium]
MSRSDIADRLAKIKSIGMFPPDIRIHELSAGGVSEYMEEWSAKGKENVARSVKETIGGRLVEIRQDALDNNVREELEDVLALYRAAIVSYILQSASLTGFPVKQDFSGYVLGSLENLFDTLKVDALVVVKGSDHISTGGRKTLGFIGALAGIYFLPGNAAMDLGLIDRSGAILWYKIVVNPYNNDFREPEGAAKNTAEMLSGFPGWKP